MATTATAQLFQNQLAALAHQMGETLKAEYGDRLDPAQLDATLSKFMAEQNIQAQVDAIASSSGKAKKPKGERKPRAKKEISPESLCEARVWGDGKSSTQCSFAKTGDGCYCTKHQKQADVTCQPCQTNEDGSKRIGLFMGRIDDWQDGEEGVLPYKDQNGLVRIDWESDDMRALVSEQLESGSIRRPETGVGAKKGRKTTKKSKKTEQAESAAQELAATLNASTPESPTSQVDEANDLVEQMNALVSAVPSSTSDVQESTSQEVDGDEQEDAEIEIEEREHEGFAFQVDAKTNTIYYLDCEEDDEDYGAVMGTWTDDGPELVEEWAARLEDAAED